MPAMLGRKTYTREELDAAHAAIGGQLSAYRRLAEAVERSGDDDATTALGAFEERLSRALVLELDRFFVHRIRAVAGKDGNPLNEVELIAKSLLADGGALCDSTVIKLQPEASVLGLHAGDRIRLTIDDVDRLATAFSTELERRFV
jgi:hypothetical protein